MTNISTKFRTLSQHRLFVLILAVVLIFINIAGAFVYGRVDLTTDKQYSLDAASKKTVRDLKNSLTITAYFTKELPPDLLETAQYIKDTLAEYDAASGKVQVKFVDPGTNDDLKKEAQTREIPELEMQVLDKDQFKVQKGYFGLYLEYGDKHDAIPVANQVDNLEYELTSMIKKLAAETTPTVGILTGHGEHDITQIPPQYRQLAGMGGDYTAVGKALAKNYTVKPVSLGEADALKDVVTLIIPGPKEALTERDLYELDQFVMRGGHIFVLNDQLAIGDGLQAQAQESKLNELLTAYGVTVNTDSTLDASNESVAFTKGNMQYILPYPFWPKLLADYFSRSNPIMAKLQSISLPWPSSLTISQKDGLRYETLAATTKHSFTQTGTFNFDPGQQLNPTDQKSRPMAVEISGVFTSAFKDKKIPAIDTSVKTKKPEVPKASDSAAPILASTGDPRVIVVGDSDFAADSYLQRFPENLAFFMNAVDYLTVGSDLISIRAKSLTSRPLNNPSESTKNTVRIITMGMIPILVIAAGMWRYYSRNKKRQSA